MRTTIKRNLGGVEIEINEPRFKVYSTVFKDTRWINGLAFRIALHRREITEEAYPCVLRIQLSGYTHT